jgi:nitroreductase
MSDAAPDTADLFEIIRTTRSMRRLKPDPVPNELIRKILEAGVCAPSLMRLGIAKITSTPSPIYLATKPPKRPTVSATQR